MKALNECYEKEVYTRDEISNCSDVLVKGVNVAFARAGKFVVEFVVLKGDRLEVEKTFTELE